METTTTITMDNINDESTTRQSSKLSLGSSPSVLSADEQLDGDGPLTPTDKIEDEEEEEEEDNLDDDDDLSALNSILQAGSPGSLSNEEVSDEEEDDTEQDSASPLSSVPDDFPLSRSASPELPLIEELPIPPQQEVEEEEEELKKPSTRKRRKENNNGSSTIKKPKQDNSSLSITTQQQQQQQQQQQPTQTEERKRRASRSITNNIIIEPLSRPRRRQSRQEEQLKKEVTDSETDKLIEEEDEDETMEEDKSNGDEEDMEEEKIEKINESTEELKKSAHIEQDKPLENHVNENSEDIKSTHNNNSNNNNVNSIETQENDDHDYQQRHKEALDALTHIEVEFARLRDKMYEEKMLELNEEAIMIANGTHPELVTLMAEIEEKKGKRIHSAEAWRKHQHANFKQQFEGFEYQANIHFISQKNALRRNLLSSINGKRWNIEDERTKLNDPSRTDRVFPDGREMVSHKREQKEETGELQDIKEAIGFPMAPNPTGLSIQDVNDDLKILGINNNNRNL